MTYRTVTKLPELLTSAQTGLYRRSIDVVTLRICKNVLFQERQEACLMSKYNSSIVIAAKPEVGCAVRIFDGCAARTRNRGNRRGDRAKRKSRAVPPAQPPNSLTVLAVG
jgi:hypothetical protein